MESIEIKAKKRDGKGKGPARALRREGRIPAILYGSEIAPTSISVAVSEMEQALKKGRLNQLLLNLILENDEKPQRAVMVKELQKDPITSSFLHADFFEVDMSKKIKVKVPVVTTGKSKGVELGGLLQHIRRDIEILCLPNSIPESIVLDITDLGVGDSIHVKEIPIEGDAEIIADVNFTVVTVIAPKKDAAGEEDEEEGEVEAEEPQEGGDA